MMLPITMMATVSATDEGGRQNTPTTPVSVHQWPGGTRVVNSSHVEVTTGNVQTLDSFSPDFQVNHSALPRSRLKDTPGGHILAADFDPSRAAVFVREFAAGDASCKGESSPKVYFVGECVTDYSGRSPASFAYIGCSTQEVVIAYYSSANCVGFSNKESYRLECSEHSDNRRVEYECSPKRAFTLSETSARWTVPAPPADRMALVYIWNGVQPQELDSDGVYAWVMQPVLIWGHAPCSTSLGWSVVPFLQVGINSQTHCGPEVEVDEGDEIFGTIKRSSNGDWMITGAAHRKRLQRSTVTNLTVAASFFSEMKTTPSWVTVDMEIYHFKECAGFPGSSVIFDRLAIDVLEGHNLVPHWQTRVFHQGNHDGGHCGQDVVANGTTTIEFRWANTPAPPPAATGFYQLLCTDSSCTQCTNASVVKLGVCSPGSPYAFECTGCDDGYIDFRRYNGTSCANSPTVFDEFRLSTNDCTKSGSRYRKYECSGATGCNFGPYPEKQWTGLVMGASCPKWPPSYATARFELSYQSLNGGIIVAIAQWARDADHCASLPGTGDYISMGRSSGKDVTHLSKDFPNTLLENNFPCITLQCLGLDTCRMKLVSGSIGPLPSIPPRDCTPGQFCPGQIPCPDCPTLPCQCPRNDMVK